MARLDQLLQAAARQVGEPAGQEAVEPFALVLGAGLDCGGLPGGSVGAVLILIGLGHRPRDWTETMQALKILVAVMGALIIVGTVIVVVTIAQRMSRGGAAPGFGKAALVLPQGCRVVEMVS